MHKDINFIISHVEEMCLTSSMKMFSLHKLKSSRGTNTICVGRSHFLRRKLSFPKRCVSLSSPIFRSLSAQIFAFGGTANWPSANLNIIGCPQFAPRRKRKTLQSNLPCLIEPPTFVVIITSSAAIST
jgi:hypothetical protein